MKPSVPSLSNLSSVDLWSMASSKGQRGKFTVDDSKIQLLTKFVHMNQSLFVTWKHTMLPNAAVIYASVVNASYTTLRELSLFCFLEFI